MTINIAILIWMIVSAIAYCFIIWLDSFTPTGKKKMTNIQCLIVSFFWPLILVLLIAQCFYEYFIEG
jgi:RsiW-degrading membrane proteinase PrsW (M82 family)